MLSNLILLNGGVLAADKAIKYKPETSVLKLNVGDKITFTQATFAQLAATRLFGNLGEVRLPHGTPVRYSSMLTKSDV